MTTLTLSNVATITLTDGRIIRLDGSVEPTTAVKAIASTPSIQRQPKAKRTRKAAKPMDVATITAQVKFWSGKASKSQIARIKEAGSTKRDSTLAKMTAIEARAELGRVNPAAKLAVIHPDVLAALKA
jgi:spore coat protein CotH